MNKYIEALLKDAIELEERAREHANNVRAFFEIEPADEDCVQEGERSENNEGEL